MRGGRPRRAGEWTVIGVKPRLSQLRNDRIGSRIEDALGGWIRRNPFTERSSTDAWKSQVCHVLCHDVVLSSVGRAEERHWGWDTKDSETSGGCSVGCGVKGADDIRDVGSPGSGYGPDSRLCRIRIRRIQLEWTSDGTLKREDVVSKPTTCRSIDGYVATDFCRCVDEGHFRRTNLWGRNRVDA